MINKNLPALFFYLHFKFESLQHVSKFHTLLVSCLYKFQRVSNKSTRFASVKWICRLNVDFVHTKKHL